MELEKEAELASKYRDRAKERRAVQDQDEETAAANEKVLELSLFDIQYRVANTSSLFVVGWL